MKRLGRPIYSEEQYQTWLEELKPFLKRGKSLSKAIELAGLQSHRTTLYEKYRLKDEFSDKIDAFQNELGEQINDIVYDIIQAIHQKVKSGETLNRLEVKQLLFISAKHRSAQKYFINRYEVAVQRPIEEVIGGLEYENETIDDVAENVQKQLEELTGKVAQVNSY